MPWKVIAETMPAVQPPPGGPLPWEAISTGSFVWSIHEKRYGVKSSLADSKIIWFGAQSRGCRGGDEWIPAPKEWTFEVREVNGEPTLVPVGRAGYKRIAVQDCELGGLYRRDCGEWVLTDERKCDGDDRLFYCLESETYDYLPAKEMVFIPSGPVSLIYEPKEE